ncbi:DUF3667 domain-containing protein [Flavobacterium sp.]|uniref:DUF3667 domain-containing protein n=1 Tax=Flavobacterium sp. TaxID=239 RepID=UPI00262A04EC|nr:DUF3667 domain-containing protein [Flavobacterium sp.]
MGEYKNSSCINCSTEIIGKFCHNCSQKSNTQRLDIKHFIQHDIIHGVFHFDKGLPFTLKEIILRPSIVAKNYIEGKRVRYYNFFYLTLVIIGFTILAQSFIDKPSFRNNNPNYLKSLNFARENIKYILLSFIPFFAISSRIVYRKVKLNFAEHCIIASICLIYFLMFNLLSDFLKILNLDDNTNPIINIITATTIITIYYQVFSEYYQNKRYINVINAILTLFFFIIFFVLLVSFIVLFITMKVE